MMRRFLLMAAAAALWLGSPAPAAATPTLPGQDQEEDRAALAEFRAAIDELRATMLRPGERVEGWDRGGAHPDADVRALGAETHYLLVESDQGTGVSILTDRPIADFAPPEWRVVDSYGSAGEALDNSEVDFQHLSARYVLAGRSDAWLQNDASCFRNISHALLYEIPGAPASEDDEIIPMMFRMLILALEDQTICMRYDGDRRQGWRIRFFLPDGRLLPELTRADDLVTIVPSAPVDRLLRPAPAGASGAVY